MKKVLLLVLMVLMTFIVAVHFKALAQGPLQVFTPSFFSGAYLPGACNAGDIYFLPNDPSLQICTGSNVIKRVSLAGEDSTAGTVTLSPSGMKPSCAAGQRGKLWYTVSATMVADKLEVCAKDAMDAYSWTALF